MEKRYKIKVQLRHRTTTVIDLTSAMATKLTVLKNKESLYPTKASCFSPHFAALGDYPLPEV